MRKERLSNWTEMIRWLADSTRGYLSVATRIHHGKWVSSSVALYFRNNTSFPLRNFHESGFCEIKVLSGGLHQPPLLLSWYQLGGQRLVAVTVMVPL